MRTYYRGPDAIVTSTYFVWRAESPHVFPIADLHSVSRAERRIGWLRLRRRFEICAHVRGAEVTVYATEHPRLFNQVTRALRRALEETR